MGDFYKAVQTILTIILLLILHFCFVMPHITRICYIFYKGRGQIYDLEAKKKNLPIQVTRWRWRMEKLQRGMNFALHIIITHHKYRHKSLNMSLLLTIYLKKSVYNEIYIYTYK